MLRFMGSQRVGHDRATELNTRLQLNFSLSEKLLFIRSLNKMVVMNTPVSPNNALHSHGIFSHSCLS